MEVIRAIEKVPIDADNEPRVDVIIAACGNATSEMVAKKDAVSRQRREILALQTGLKVNTPNLEQIAEEMFGANKSKEDDTVATTAEEVAVDLLKSFAKGDSQSEKEQVYGANEGSRTDRPGRQDFYIAHPEPGASERERKLFELRLKLNKARQGNNMAVLDELRREEDPGRSMKRQKTEAAILEEKKGATFGTEGYLQDSLTLAQSRAAKNEKKGANETFGWDVFNQDTLYRAHEKKLKGLNLNERAYEEQRQALGDRIFFQGASVEDSLANREIGNEEHDVCGSSGLEPKTLVVRHKPSDEAKDRLAELMTKHKESRRQFSRRRVVNPDEEVTYINERNRHFNKKIERAFGEYTTKIKQNLERGTAL